MKREHKPCYGTMFHDTLHFDTNQAMKGKVFSFELDTVGLARSDRQVKVDIEEWDDCLECPEFAHCYKLCMAKLTLATAVAAD
ncbi:MAG: hypothetical protein OEU92_28195 [Alphaproteobacteria bacterium]|nr:hypothetical protein [Alphaproteobacteria bacterium]